MLPPVLVANYMRKMDINTTQMQFHCHDKKPRIAPPTFKTSNLLKDTMSCAPPKISLDLQKRVMAPNAAQFIIYNLIVSSHAQSIDNFPLLFNGEQDVTLNAQHHHWNLG